MTTRWRRFKRRVSRRGAALLFFALVGLSFGVSLAFPAPVASQANAYAALVLPLPVWAALWTITGVVCAVYAFIPHHDRFAFTVMMGTTTGWALVAFFSALTGVNPRGWVGGFLFGAFAAWIYIIAGWPDLPRDVYPVRPEEAVRE